MIGLEYELELSRTALDQAQVRRETHAESFSSEVSELSKKKMELYKEKMDSDAVIQKLEEDLARLQGEFSAMESEEQMDSELPPDEISYELISCFYSSLDILD